MSEPSDPNQARPRELTGQVGKYEITRPIGKGAMGQIFLARDTVLERDVALKVMSPQIVDDPELKARFEREAKAIAKMTHPNVVMVFDLGNLDDGSPYIAMELLKGQDLQRAMRRPPPMTLERKVAIIVQVLAGLAHAHEQGIIHRDIKPANIFVVTDDSVKITDFGVAHLTTSSMTGTGSVVGTADYMSPEQVKGDRIDGRSDLFSVGCMLFELVTGRRPFHSDNLMAIFYKITHERPNFDLLPAGVEYDALLPILKKALARDIDERYQTAAAFAVDLRDWLRAHATTASSQNVLEALLDLEAPPHSPQPLTQTPGRTVVPGEGSGARATVALDAESRPPAPRPGSGRVGPPPVKQLRPRRIQRRNPLPWIALAAAATATVAGLGYVAWRARSTPSASPPVTLAASPTATPAPPPTPAPTPATPVPTAAPQPTFAETGGVAAESVRRADDAFKAGRYGQAVESAQRALREDPSNTSAQQILDNALNGQKAATRLQAGEAALAGGDLPAAEREAAAARSLAPWDQAAVDLSRRVDRAKVAAEQKAAADAAAERQRDTRRVGQLIEEGTNALAARQYDAAISAYDRALRLDPQNPAAATGKSNAVAAKTMAETAASRAPAPPPGPPTRRLVSSGSVARRSVSDAGGVPPGFEASPGVEVRQGSQGAALPGDLAFEVSPSSPKAGERYSVAAYLRNEGSQPIQLDTMVVTTTIDGRKQQGRVAPSASVVAPHQRALVFQIRNEVWKRNTRSWEMEIVVFTSQRETYRNTLTWK
ncbi:MAG: protein kinase [Acidobacteria bacterium]|nr:protein kinase [Acidobacteriota bacterium]